MNEEFEGRSKVIVHFAPCLTRYLNEVREMKGIMLKLGPFVRIFHLGNY